MLPAFRLARCLTLLTDLTFHHIFILYSIAVSLHGHGVADNYRTGLHARAFKDCEPFHLLTFQVYVLSFL